MNNEYKERLSLLVSLLRHFNPIESCIPGLEKLLAVNFIPSCAIRIVRGNKSLPYYFGLMLSEPNDWIYIGKSGNLGCIRVKVADDCSLDLSTLEDAHFPVVSTNVELSDLKDISELESKHMLARALLIDANAVEETLAASIDSINRWASHNPDAIKHFFSYASYARLVVIRFRKMNIAHLLYSYSPTLKIACMELELDLTTHEMVSEIETTFTVSVSKDLHPLKLLPNVDLVKKLLSNFIKYQLLGIDLSGDLDLLLLGTTTFNNP